MSDSTPHPPAFASSILSTGSAADGGDVRLTDLSHLAKVVVRTTDARPDGLGVRFGSSDTVGGATVCGSRPREWLVLGAPDAVAAVTGSIGAYAIDLTHGRALIEVAGPAAASTLEKVCSLDLSDAMLPDGAVTSASVAKVTCDVIRRDIVAVDAADRQPAYLIATDRSFGQYLFDALADAATEFRT